MEIDYHEVDGYTVRLLFGRSVEEVYPSGSLDRALRDVSRVLPRLRMTLAQIRSEGDFRRAA